MIEFTNAELALLRSCLFEDKSIVSTYNSLAPLRSPIDQARAEITRASYNVVKLALYDKITVYLKDPVY